MQMTQSCSLSREVFMPEEFAGQVAVVTGAARGLGFAVATLLCERGARVILVDIDAEAVRRAANELTARGHQAIAAVVDAGDEDQLALLRAEIETREKRLDVLVNNAGGWRYGRVHEILLSDWDWTFRTNVTLPFLTSRALMDLMIARGYGRIVNVASTDAYRPKPKLPHYAAAKAAVVSFTKSLAEELAPRQILVNAVSPGPIATETAKQQDWLAERVKSIPLGRAAEPEDIAEVILFLASPRNRYIVGETIIANGGMLMI
jgi:3-oxoacyl-[acyl-carrier protein] reductase